MSKKKEKKSKLTKLDQFHYHEACDRAYLLVNTIESNLLGHGAIEAHKKLKNKVKKASALIAEVSQLAGELEFALFPETQKPENK